MVRYLGGYVQEQGSRSSTQNSLSLEATPGEKIYNVILEYGERDLHGLFLGEIPPILEDEIEALWNKLFEVAETVNRIHNLTIKDDRVTKKYYG